MAGTIRGLPFPTGTDKVVDGDNAIRALAESIDNRPILITGGTATATTSGVVFALTPIRDPNAMIASNRITIPAGFGGVWLCGGRVNQSGTVATTASVRQAGGGTTYLSDGRTGAAGASASPSLSGLITLTAGAQIELYITIATGTGAFTLLNPPFTMMFVHS